MNRGTLLIGQSGGATAVINASLVGAIDAGEKLGGFDRVLGMRSGFAGLLEERFIDLTGLPVETRETLRRTPGSALGTGRLKGTDAQLDQAVQILERHHVRAMVLIGGNDSADTVLRLGQRTGERIAVTLAPKTVDNDLEETYFCPGFPSAARFLANLVRDATWDSLSAPDLYPVKLIEVPGRDAGWLPASGCLGFTEHDTDLHPLVFVPEAPPASVEAMVAAIVSRVETHRFVVVIVPETLRDRDGNHLGGSVPEYVDPFGHPYFRSSGEGVARVLRELTGIRARVERPGSATRMMTSVASDIDRVAAYASGQYAAELAASGRGGVMAAISPLTDGARIEVEAVDLGGVANRVRALPAAYYDDRKLVASAAFANYALPLLGVDPFPRYLRLDPAD